MSDDCWSLSLRTHFEDLKRTADKNSAKDGAKTCPGPWAMDVRLRFGHVQCVALVLSKSAHRELFEQNKNRFMAKSAMRLWCNERAFFSYCRQ